MNKHEFSTKTKELLGGFPKRIFESLLQGNGLTQYLYSQIDTKGATLLFNEWETYIKINNMQPGDANSIYRFLSEKKLDKNFYPFYSYYTWSLFCCISKSPKYLSIESKFKKYTQNSLVIDVPNNKKLILQLIIQKVKIIINNFNENNIKFKKYDHNDKLFVYSENNIIYFSESILNEPETKWKNFVFSKCLELNGVNIEKVAEKFGLI